METTEKKPRRRRRTKLEIETEIWAALERLIVKKGIQNLTIIELAREAQVEPAVLYNRFSNLQDLVEKYIRKYDFWLKDTISINPKAEPKSEFKKMCRNLINELYKNEIMQQVLLWELNNTHRITRQIASKREVENAGLIKYFEKKITNFSGINSLLISGIYYLILHRKISTFSHINYDTQQGKELMIKTVEDIIEKMF